MAEQSNSDSVWDRRFSGEDFVFGVEPNEFLKQQVHRIPSGGRVLAVADGEGRNSTFLAGQGFRVTATDISANGIAKARHLAEERGVSVDFQQGDLASWDWPEAACDAVAAIFVQFAGPDLRDTMFDGFFRTLRPGGLLVMQGYRPEQLAYATGGPPIAENLYTEDMLRVAFSRWDIEHLESHDSVIHEGTGHAGMSALIDLVARRP